VWQEAGWLGIVFALGAITGASEITTRYRDEPLRAVANRYGGLYLLLNGVIALAAYGLLLRYPTRILPDLQGDRLILALIAGLSAMLVMRSKLLTVQSESGQDYSIGPAAVIESFLALLDRKIDRQRASKRQRLVHGSLGAVAEFALAAAYLEASLLSFQNLSEQEKRDIAQVIEQYRARIEWPERLRVMAIGFAFLTIAGEENFSEVIGTMKNYLDAEVPVDDA
jgi:hypothetical protein